MGLDCIILLLSPVIIAYQYIQTHSYDSDDTGVYISRKIGRKCSPQNLFLIALTETRQRGNSGPGWLSQNDKAISAFWMLFHEAFAPLLWLAALERWGFAKYISVKATIKIKDDILKIDPNSLPFYFFQQLKGISNRNHQTHMPLKYTGLQPSWVPGSSRNLWIQLAGKKGWTFYMQKHAEVGDCTLSILGCAEHAI